MKTFKKIIFLGGSNSQLPALKYLKEQKTQIILCDYLPDNPGRNYADIYIEESILNLNKVLEIAQKNNVEIAIGYGSDPGAYAAAYINSILKVGFNSFESVSLLRFKSQFRMFQKFNDFSHPNFIINPSEKEAKQFKYPAIIKPVDSSDSRGVYVLQNFTDYQRSKEKTLIFSHSGDWILEELLEDYKQKMHGDGYMLDGKIQFLLLYEAAFSAPSNPIKPVCDIGPSQIYLKLKKTIDYHIEKTLRIAKYLNGPFNIDLIVDKNHNVFILEIGPRSGGNNTNLATYYCTGINLVHIQLDHLAGNSIHFPEKINRYRSVILFALHFNTSGIFKDFVLPTYLDNRVKNLQLGIQKNQRVRPFSEPNSTLGNLILTFDSFEEIDQIKDRLYDEIYQAIQVDDE